MNIIIQGEGTIKLGKQNFLASGGAGDVYVKGDLAYKIFKKPVNMLDRAKIDELSILDHPDIIKPEKIILNSKNREIGYTMRYVKTTFSLCQLFPRSFKQRHNLDRDGAVQLVRDFMQKMEEIHRHNILIVDVNELNFLVDSSFSKIYFIDVDSYQTKSFPAQFIMESIRDRHSTTFSTLTDWFSWAILTFQMFTGIHPYKGKHAVLKTLDERMLQNISVFNSNVRIPPTCEPIDSIPQPFRKWYRDLFETGKRLPPPIGQKIVIDWQPVSATTQIDGTAVFLKLIRTYPDSVISVKSISGHHIVKTQKEIYLDNKPIQNIPQNCSLVVTPRQGRVIAAWLTGSELQLHDIQTNKQIPCTISGEVIMEYDGRLYIKNSGSIFELDFVELSGTILPSPKTAAQVMLRATRLFDGLVIQNVIDTWFLSIFPRQGICRQIRLDELTGYRILDAGYENGLAMFIVEKSGQYDTVLIRIDSKKHDIRIIEDTGYHDINMTVLPDKTAVHFIDHDQLELFTSMPGNNQTAIIPDDALAGMQLFHVGTQVNGVVENRIYSISQQ